MGFWVATADAAGARVTDSEVELSPAPSEVDYAQEPQGSLVESVDGFVVHQQANRDGRRRSWNWIGYPSDQPGYAPLFSMLEGLRSRYRAELGLSPFVYLKEDVTGVLRSRAQLAGTASGSDLTLTFSTPTLTADALVGGSVTIAGQVRGITANTTTTVTLGQALIGSVSGAAVVSYWTYPWVRARVLEVSRRAVAGGGRARFENSRIVFVIQDDAWDGLG
jgi:hypothetical protein